MTTTEEQTTVPPDLERALDRVAEALAAMGAGDPAPYAALWLYSEDVTLFGAWGPVERGRDAVTGTFTWSGVGSPTAHWCRGRRLLADRSAAVIMTSPSAAFWDRMPAPFIEPTPRRIRVRLGAELVADSTRAQLPVQYRPVLHGRDPDAARPDGTP